MSRCLGFIPVLIAAFLANGCGRQSGAPASTGQGSAATKDASAKKAHVFRGKLEKIDPAGKMITVNGEDVEGWMSAMTMVYEVDRPEVLSQLSVGDQITATVYDGDFRTLHDVKRLTEKPK
jgi:Cu/Ag efflux protein CusF